MLLNELIEIFKAYLDSEKYRTTLDYSQFCQYLETWLQNEKYLFEITEDRIQADWKEFLNKCNSKRLKQTNFQYSKEESKLTAKQTIHIEFYVIEFREKMIQLLFGRAGSFIDSGKDNLQQMQSKRLITIQEDCLQSANASFEFQISQDTSEMSKNSEEENLIQQRFNDYLLPSISSKQPDSLLINPESSLSSHYYEISDSGNSNYQISQSLPPPTGPILESDLVTTNQRTRQTQDFETIKDNSDSNMGFQHKKARVTSEKKKDTASLANKWKKQLFLPQTERVEGVDFNGFSSSLSNQPKLTVSSSRNSSMLNIFDTDGRIEPSKFFCEEKQRVHPIQASKLESKINEKSTFDGSKKRGKNDTPKSRSDLLKQPCETTFKFTDYSEEVHIETILHDGQLVDQINLNNFINSILPIVAQEDKKEQS